MTLDEFLKSAPTTLAAFEASTREKFASGEGGMNPDQHRPEFWWWNDVAAYLQFVELQEQIAHRDGELPR